MAPMFGWHLTGNALTFTSVIAATMGPILMGLSTGYPSPAGGTMLNKEKVNGVRVQSPENYAPFDQAQYAWFGAILSLGTMVGCGLAPYVSDRLGRRTGSIVALPIYIMGNLAVALARSALLLILGRCFMGVSLGILLTCTTVYLSEIAPPHLRGRLGSASQIAIMTGTSLSYFLGGFVFRLEGGVFCDWRMLAWFLMGPAALMFTLMLFFCPESPRWLAMKNRVEDAKYVLSALRGGRESAAEIEGLENSRPQKSAESVNKRQLLKENWRQLFCAILIMSFRMLSGVHMFSFFRAQIFAEAGVSNEQFWTLMSSLVAIVTACFASLAVDRLGRKALFIGADVAMAAGYCMLALAFLCPEASIIAVPAMVFASGAFSLGVGPVPFILGPELLSNSVRSLGVGVGGVLQWGVSFLTARTMHDIRVAIGFAGVFFMYAGICVCMALVVGFCVPETKGKSFEEIQAIFTGQKKDVETGAADSEDDKKPLEK